jgi:PleD family two-component response regulator
MKIYDEGMFLSHLDIEIAKSERYRYPFSIIMFEIADDTHNNIEMMKSLVETNYRASDVVSVFGDKTFAILLNGVNEEGANKFLNRLIKKAVKEKGISIKVAVREYQLEDTRKIILKDLEKQLDKKK